MIAASSAAKDASAQKRKAPSAMPRSGAQESRLHSAIMTALGGGIKASAITGEMVSFRVSPRQKGSIDGTLAGLIALAGVCAVLLAGGLPT
jgi:hypothetical protein